MSVRKIAFVCLSVLLPTAIYANVNLCPETNSIPGNNSFWRCVTPDNCNGQGQFIGATLVNFEGGTHYWCSYSGEDSAKSSIITTSGNFPTPNPKQKRFIGEWKWMENVNRIICETSDPRRCPIPAFRER